MISYLDQLREQARLKQISDMLPKKQPPSGLLGITEVLKTHSKKFQKNNKNFWEVFRIYRDADWPHRGLQRKGMHKKGKQ